MAEAAVTSALNFLTPLLVDQVKLLGGVSKEVAFLKDELEMLRAFLQDADQKQQSDPAVKIWVKQLREVAYDIEDVVDEFLLRVGMPGRRTRHTRANRRGTAYITRLTAQYHISKRIIGIKTQLQSITERKERLSLETKSSSSSEVRLSSSFDSRLMIPLLMDEYELVGIEKPKKDLIAMLIDGESRLAVIPIVGMGGLGKTTIAYKVYENQKIRLHFQCYAWITISHAYDINTILSKMILEFHNSNNEPAPESIMCIDDFVLLAQSVKSYVREKRYAIFLDDVWQVADWENFIHILPENGFGSRVIVTTRNHDVANSCARPNDKIYELQTLSPQHAWTLFCRKAFALSAQDGTCPLFLEEVVRKILKICGGLPLAIITVVGLLRSKSMTLAEWDKVYRSLSVEIDTNKAFENTKKIILISYNDLPHHLKLCLIYLSLYPEDYYIRRSIITQMWIAEGFIKPMTGLSLEEASGSCVEELVKRSLIQIVPQFVDGTRKGRVFVLHDLMREVIITKSKEQKFVNIFPCNEELQAKVRRLSIHDEMPSDLDAWEPSYMRTLTIFDSMQGLHLSMFKGLKVLSLNGLQIESFPNDIVNLLHLRYLSLRATKIEVIPDSIKKLKWLQTLDIKSSRVEKLPEGILKCQQLVHIIASKATLQEMFQLVRVPIEIGNLRSLRKLRYVVLEDYRHLKGLGRLIQLRKLFVGIERGEDLEPLCASIKNMKQLKSLGVWIKDSMSVLDAHLVLATSSTIKRIALLALLRPLTSDMIGSLESICKLRLAWSQLTDGSLSVLQQLPNLLDLTLQLESYDGKTLHFEVGSFSKLKSLRLLSLFHLTQVIIDKGAIPQLQSLVIGWCHQLCHVPTGIEHLALKVLFLRCMPKELMDKVRKDDGEEWDKVKHIPDIIIQMS